MKRRDFIKAVIGALGVAVIPNTGLPEPILPKRTRIYDAYRQVGISQDALDDIKAWGVDRIDEKTRREIMVNCNGIQRMVSVNRLTS